MMGWFTLVSDGFALTCEVCGHGPLSWNVDQPELQKWVSGGNDENTHGGSAQWCLHPTSMNALCIFKSHLDAR